MDSTHAHDPASPHVETGDVKAENTGNIDPEILETARAGSEVTPSRDFSSVAQPPDVAGGGDIVTELMQLSDLDPVDAVDAAARIAALLGAALDEESV